MPLPSNVGSSNGPDWKDLADMISAFEKQNHVTIEVTVNLVETNEDIDLKLCAKAWEQGADRRVHKPLASKSVLCRAERCRRLEAVFTYLLYSLDFMLAEHEWDAAKNKRA